MDGLEVAATLKLKLELVRPTDAKAGKDEPRLVLLSTEWCSVLEDMTTTSEAVVF